MADWRDAVQEVQGGVRLLVEVAAGAKQERFPDGFNAWREGRIGVRVKAPAQDGRANAEVVAAVGTFFGVQASVEAGATDSRKSIVVRMDRRQAVLRLATVLP